MEFCVQDIIQLKTSSEWEREYRELQRTDVNATNSMPYSATRICVCLLVPQILLGLPAVSDIK